MKVYLIASPPFASKATTLGAQLEMAGWSVRPFADLASWQGSAATHSNGTEPPVMLLAGDFHELARHHWIRQVKQTEPAAAVVAWGSGGRLADAIQLIKQGAHDVLEESELLPNVIGALHAARELGGPSRTDLEQRQELKNRLSTLTPSESAVLSCMLAGSANKQIALELRLGLRTVELRRARIMQKLGASNLAELVKFVCEARVPQPV